VVYLDTILNLEEMNTIGARGQLKTLVVVAYADLNTCLGVFYQN